MALKIVIDTRVIAIVRDLIDTDPDHYHLKNADVTVALLEKTGNPLKLHGYECAATIKKTTARDRELGVEDAVMTFDAGYLRALLEKDNDKELRALIDHELYHLEVVIDEWEHEQNPDGTTMFRDGAPVKKRARYKYDDAGRPKLNIRLHDIQMGHFSRMVEKHGKHSGEARQIKHLTDHFGNLLFNFSATEEEISETRTRFAWRMDRVPPEFHHDYEEELSKRDRKMVRSQKTGAKPVEVEEEA